MTLVLPSFSPFLWPSKELHARENIVFRLSGNKQTDKVQVKFAIGSRFSILSIACSPVKEIFLLVTNKMQDVVTMYKSTPLY